MFNVINFPKKFKLKNFFFNFILFQINLIKICNLEEDILNNILVFDSKHYRAGHFAFNSNGDMIIEYSNNNSRLFYGLKKNGKFFFKDEQQNEIPTKEIILGNSNYVRYESKNSFISLKNDNNNKEYLFSSGTQDSMTELFDIDNLDINNYKLKITSEYLSNTIFSYTFSLLAIDDIKEYLIIYLSESNNNVIIQKLSFSNFEIDSSQIIQTKSIPTTLVNRIVNSFIMNDKIIVFYLNNNEKYAINIYDQDLNPTNENIIIADGKLYKGYGVFSEGIYLKDDFCAFIYFKAIESTSLELKLGNLNSSFQSKFIKSFSDYSFNYDVKLNDLVKINNERFAFITVSSDSMNIFYILLFDLYNENKNMKIRVYQLELNGYEINWELASDTYNGFLVLSSTVINYGETEKQTNNNRFSIFMIFGYVNGTDELINIYEYFSDDNNNNNDNNIVTNLTESLVIDNNIFNYVVLKDQIKLVSIPEEIIFYDKNDIFLQLTNGSVLYTDYILKQNKIMVKTNKNYSIDFQLIIREPDYDTFNKNPKDIINCSSSDSAFEDQKNYFRQKVFYGRTNTLKFKLCHPYCATCTLIGKTINDQKCKSCLNEYQYDYPDITLPNCVPQGYFKESQDDIKECNYNNSNFYIDTSNNKSICFKKTFLCPEDYPFLIKSTHECKASCSYSELYSKDCVFSQVTEIIYKELKEDVIKTYPIDGESLVIEAEEEYVFQLTSSLNEVNSLKRIKANGYNLSMMDLGHCEDLLKQTNGIDLDTPLIILKFEKLTNIASEKNIQYEIFNPINKTKMDLSICQSNPFNIYIPIVLSEKTQNLYEDLADSGYNLFDINDPFYQDICSTYESENGTDVPLSDRKNDFYSANETMCQINCNYSNYSFESAYLKCKCNVENDNIDTDNIEKFSAKMLYSSFYEVLKYSNFKIVKCYKLVFNINVLKKNYGSIIAIIFFACYLAFFVIYLLKGISPFEIDTVKTIIEKKKMSNNSKNNDAKYMNTKDIKKKDEDVDIYNKKNNDHKLTKIQKTEIYNNRHKNNIKQKETNNPKKKKNKSKLNLIKINSKNYLVERDSRKAKSKTKIDKSYFKLSSKSISTKRKMGSFLVKRNMNDSSKINNLNDSDITKEEKLDDYELNELEYLPAIELDKRPFSQIYWSTLKRNHIVLLTFFSWNDYNIYYIKFARFLFLISTDMALNVFFFTDDSMHKIYLNYGKYDFIQSIPQTIYTTAISQLIEVLLSYLSMTDKHIYQIKHLKDVKMKKIIIFQNLKCIKLKLIGFFVFTFVFFAFYWYLISCFCAVYENTQVIFIKDSISTFFTGLVYPFILYLIPSSLRILALRDVNKKRTFIYKLSDIIPIC